MQLIKEKTNISPIVITDIQDKESREFLSNFSMGRVFNVPKSGFLSALLCVFPLQRLAYELTLAKGLNPDRPRNLAKELTTK